MRSKGGFFLGGAMLGWLGFAPALWTMAGALLLTLLTCVVALPREIGRAKEKVGFGGMFSMTPAVNILSAARFFLFGARDVWFVVGLPVFLYDQLGWNFAQVGGFLAAWVIGYGFVQAAAPLLTSARGKKRSPTGNAAIFWTFRFQPSRHSWPGVLSRARPNRSDRGRPRHFRLRLRDQLSVHSYLILAYSDGDKVALNVGFYYMANAGGRLAGTVLSGWLFQVAGLPGCLWASAAMAARRVPFASFTSSARRCTSTSTRMKKLKVLFICVHNSARSQMAAAFLNESAPMNLRRIVPALKAVPVDPLAIQVMSEVGIDISKNATRTVFDAWRSGPMFTHVITVCSEAEVAARSCPIFPSPVQRLSWPFDDPTSFQGSSGTRLERMRSIRDQIEQRVRAWCDEVCPTRSAATV